MASEPTVFSGTLKVRVCQVLWSKTPVQLTYHRQDYHPALPVLLIRRSSLFGGDLLVHLDPCVHPVRLLPTTERMAKRMEFALEYGWRTKQIRLRAPDIHTYTKWKGIVTAALESGRRPPPSCCDEEPRQDLACSSLASTLNSSNATLNATIRRRVLEEPEEEEDAVRHLEDIGVNWQTPSDFFVLHHVDFQSDAVFWHQDALVAPSLSSPSSAAVGSCNAEVENLPIQTKPYIPMDTAAVLHQLFLQTRFLFFVL